MTNPSGAVSRLTWGASSVTGRPCTEVGPATKMPPLGSTAIPQSKEYTVGRFMNLLENSSADPLELILATKAVLFVEPTKPLPEVVGKSAELVTPTM